MKMIANNKKAYFDYFISDNLEVGIELKGCEVKSIRAGGISLADTFITIDNGELFLKNCYIKPYEKTAAYIPDSKRNRKLLAHKEEIQKLEKKADAKGFSIQALKVGLSNGKVKLEIGLAKGKKQYDKKNVLVEKSQKREIEQATKAFLR